MISPRDVVISSPTMTCRFSKAGSVRLHADDVELSVERIGVGRELDLGADPLHIQDRKHQVFAGHVVAVHTGLHGHRLERRQHVDEGRKGAHRTLAEAGVVPLEQLREHATTERFDEAGGLVRLAHLAEVHPAWRTRSEIRQGFDGMGRNAERIRDVVRGPQGDVRDLHIVPAGHPCARVGTRTVPAAGDHEAARF